MKDLLGREVQVGNYIAYALTAGRSANLAIYQVKEVHEDKIKANKITESCGSGNWKLTLKDGKEVLRRYCKFVHVPGGESYHEEMTDAEKAKLNSKVTTLSMPERIFVLDGFTPEVMNKQG